MLTAAMYIIAGLVMILVLSLSLRIKRRVAATLGSSALGILLLTGLNLLSGVTGIHLGYSGLALFCSTMLGIPGVIGMLFMNVVSRT